MPALPSISTALLATLSARDIPTPAASATANATATATATALQVVCAFPVSGQYGLGSRVLYYVLIAACVVGKNIQWLRTACLAAALLFPAVAAIHGIVLVVLHLPNAVDMDIYGAFQLCAIGILATPITAKLSRTYFNDPGRNAIFVWTILVLIGLLCLTVEFFRTNTSPCPFDNSGQPISPNPRAFNFANPPTCNLQCNLTAPQSPIRQGSANNIYVIPAPERITFGMGTLLAAACCIPALLSLISMWNKILEINWKSRFGNRNVKSNQPIEGTNGATEETMTHVNKYIRNFLGVVEAPVYGAAVFFILIMGELNFSSYQVSYQTEPMTAIGQWAPMAGTGLAVLGSLYVKLVHGEPDFGRAEDGAVSPPEPEMSERPRNRSASPSPSYRGPNRGADGGRPPLSNGGDRTPDETVPPMAHVRRTQTTATGRIWSEQTFSPAALQRSQTEGPDLGGRRKIAKALNAISDRLGSANLDTSAFKRGRAVEYPTLPGEEFRSRELRKTQERYKRARDIERDADGIVTPHQRSHSRGSFASPNSQGLGIDFGGSSSRTHSPRRPTMPTEQTSGDLEKVLSNTTTNSIGAMPQRRLTLEVPPTTHHSGHLRTLSGSSVAFDDSVNRPLSSSPTSSPAIVVSDPEAESAVD